MFGKASTKCSKPAASDPEHPTTGSPDCLIAERDPRWNDASSKSRIKASAHDARPSRRKELRDAIGTRIDLRHQSLVVLRYLAVNAGRVVIKDELLTALWPGLSVTDDSLTQCISDIRRALGDAGPGRARLLCDPAAQLSALERALA